MSPAPGTHEDPEPAPRGLRRPRIGLLLGPLLLFGTLLTEPPAGMPAEAWRTTGVGLLMAAWWMSEAIAIPATALLPLVLLPVLGLGSIETAAGPYANPVIFLFMGGFMIAQAVQRWGLHRRIALHLVRFVGTQPLRIIAAVTRSGLADWIGAALAGIGAFPVLALMFVVALVIIFLTELTSNTASAAAFLPVLAALAVGIGEDPLLLAVPAALGASCAFMLPVATPPNAIVFSSSFITIPQMARAGFVLNLLFALAVPLVSYLALLAFFGL